MSDFNIDLEFKLNTPEVKKGLKDIETDSKSVNDTVKDGNKPLQDREGLLERLKRRMSELRQESEKANDITGIAKYNKEIQLFEQEIVRATRAGRKGFDENGYAMVSNEGLLQRLQRAAMLYERAMFEATRPENLEKYSQKLALVNAEMSRLTSKAGGGGQWNGLQNSINQISRELPAFTYSIQTGFMAVSNNIPIVIDEIVRLRLANAALVASGQKGVPVWKQVAGSIFSWGTALSVGITILTVFGKEIGEWMTALFKGKNALDDLKKANEEFKATRLKGTQDAQKELVSLESLYRATQNTTLSVSQRKKAVDALQSQYPSYFKNMSDEQIMAGKAAGSYDKLKDSIIAAARARAYSDKISELATKRLENEDKIINLASKSETAQAQYKTQKSTLDKTDPLGNVHGYNAVLGRASSAQALVEKVNKDITDLNIANNSLDKEMHRYQTNIDNAVKANGVEILTGVGKVNENKDKGVNKLYSRIAESSKDLLNKIGELDKEYARKSMESDEAELQGLKDKFDKFRVLIEDENRKIETYNKANKGKKGFKAVDLIDVNQLDPIQNTAIEDLKYKHETNSLKKEIEVQKQIFAEYEEYKNKLGQDKADDAFKGRLKGFKSYVDYLKSVADQENVAVEAVENKKATAGQQERAKVVTDEQKQSEAAERKKQTDLLTLVITYDKKRKELIRKFEAERATLVANHSADELSEFDRKHIEELNSLDDSNIQKLDSYKALFEGIEKLTDAGARRVIENAQDLLATGVNLSPEMLKKIREALKDATKSLDNRLPERVMKVSGAFGQMAQEIGEVNEELGSMLQGVSNILSASVQIGENFTALNKGLDNYDKYKKDKANGTGGGLLGGVSAIAGILGPAGQIAGAIAGVATGVVKFFGAAKESARQAEKQLKEYQLKIIEGEMEYARLIRERARSQKDVNDMSLTELATQRALLQTQLEIEKERDLSYNKAIKRKIGNYTVNTIEKIDRKEVLSDYEYALEKIRQEGLEVTGQRKERYGGFLGMGKKTRLVDVTASLAGKTYEDLEKLYTEGKMNEATKSMFENLQKAKNEVDDINELMKEIDEQIMDKMTGGITASSIIDPIIHGIKEGKRHFSDFGTDIEDIIQNALLAGMSATVLEEPLKELVKKFREDSKDGLSQDEIDEFKKGYEDVVKEGLDALKIIEDSYGAVGSKDSISSIKSEGIERVSEITGAEIAGTGRAHLDVSKQNLDVSKQNLIVSQKSLDFHLKSHDILIRQLKSMAAIEQHTGDTVNRLDKAITILELISDNTKGGYYGS